MFKSKLVWMSICLPLLASLIFLVMILMNETDLIFDPTISGFANFYKWFSVPLYTAALVFPLAAISISNYRAEQAERQIKLSREQNVFVNYYKHHEEFEKRLEKLEKRFGIEFKEKSGLYSLFFPKNTPYEIDINARSEFANKIIEEFQSSISVLNSYYREYVKADDITFKQKCALALCVLSEINRLRTMISYEQEHSVRANFISTNDHAPAFLSIKDDTDYVEITIIDEVLHDLCSFSFIEYDRVSTEENRASLKMLNTAVQILFAFRAPGLIKGSAHWEPKKEHARDNRPDVVDYFQYRQDKHNKPIQATASGGA
ncbi:hypothetical protein [Ferrimonas kyonanensis]|uniref:hypothetical protein n=1 Tax=Ferrimonas kyonanensis TaxID=364763 RepID=UPI000412AFEB|nr:hypothetical protein [Ferrimonas kyonanensis]